VQVYRDDGVVLRTQKLGEADRIITLLTRQNGRIRAVARGVRRTKSRFGARLEPFTHVDLMIHPGRTLDVITQAEVIRAYGPPLAADYPKYTAGAAMLETAERLTPVESEPAIRQFLLLIAGLRALGDAAGSPLDPGRVGRDPWGEALEDRLQAERDPRLVLDAYFLRSLAVAGYAPSLDACARCGAADGATAGQPGGQDAGRDLAAVRAGAPGEAPGNRLTAFAVAAGGMVCESCRPPGAAAPGPQTIALMRALLRGDWAAAMRTERRHRVECSGLVAAYLQWHLEHTIRSLRHVERA
jgi:DNA repair protein RecO (recombination protein O)